MFNLEQTFSLNWDIIKTLCETDQNTSETAFYYKVDKQIIKSLNHGNGAFNYTTFGFKYPIQKHKLHNILVLQRECERRNIPFYVTSTTLQRLKSF